MGGLLSAAASAPALAPYFAARGLWVRSLLGSPILRPRRYYFTTKNFTTAVRGLTPYETMQELDTLLSRAGQRGVSYQAERIVRTEVQRVYSIALDTQVQSLAALVESPNKLLKQWVSGPFRPGRREKHQ